MKRLRRDREDSYPGDDENDIDIIPLVDVMFLLLTFFIFMTLAMVIQEGVNVSLASAESGESVERKEPIVLSVDESGQYFFNKSEVTEETLRRRLERTAEQNPEKSVFINADQSVNHRSVIEVLDAVRRSGLSNVTFTVKPSE